MSLTFNEAISESQRIAVEHGWWDGGERPVGDQFTNFYGEVAEAWEEYRKYGMDPAYFLYYVEGKPEGMAVELADVLIRIFDTCAHYNIPLEQALVEKMAYNETRPYRHGNKKA